MSELNAIDASSLNSEIGGLILPIGLRIDQIRIQTAAIRLEFQPFRIALSEPGKVEATITESDLQTYLNVKAPGGLKDFEVLMADEKIAVTATAKVVFEIRATALCRLEILDGTKLNIVLESVSVPIAHNIVQNQLAQINPVLDISELPIEGTLDRAVPGNGKLELLISASKSSN